MQSVLQTYTSLPNLHPALVHFPIVLWMVALLFDAGALFWRKQRWLDNTAVSLYILGLLGGGATYWAGTQAADLVGELPNKAALLLQAHSDWALRTLIFFSVLTLCRVGFAVTQRNEVVAGGVPWRFVLLVAAIVGQGFLFQTTDRGGALVYHEGVSVAKQATQATPHAHPHHAHSHHASRPSKRATLPGKLPQNSPASRLQHKADGGLTWSPGPNDGRAFGTLLHLAKGTPSGALTTSPPSPNQTGLAFEVTKRAILVFPQRHADVRVRVHLAFDTFQGSFGLAHHVHHAKRASLFAISTRGRAFLFQQTPSKRKQLDRSRFTLPGSSFELSVSSVGRHLKGFLNKRTVVHGHISPDAPGMAGLYFDGRGRIRILSLSISPIGQAGDSGGSHKGHKHKSGSHKGHKHGGDSHNHKGHDHH